MKKFAVLMMAAVVLGMGDGRLGRYDQYTQPLLF